MQLNDFYSSCYMTIQKIIINKNTKKTTILKYQKCKIDTHISNQHLQKQKKQITKHLQKVVFQNV